MKHAYDTNIVSFFSHFTSNYFNHITENPYSGNNLYSVSFHKTVKFFREGGESASLTDPRNHSLSQKTFKALWLSICEKTQMHLGEFTNQFAPNQTPIPNTESNINTKRKRGF